MKFRFHYALVLLPLLLVSCHEADSLNSDATEEKFTDLTTPSSDSTEEETDIADTFEYEVGEKTVMKGEYRIVGDYYRPKTDGKTPLVILSHSAFLTGKSLRAYARFFAGHGYSAYAFDFCGGSKNSRSDGIVSEMTIFTEADDLKQVYETFSSLSEIDSERIYLFGSSQGGLVTSVAAKEMQEGIAGLFLLYPAFNIPEQVKNSFFSGPYGEEFIETMKDYDPFQGMEDFSKPVLIFHGTKDSTVPIAFSEKAVSLYPKGELFRIEGASHGFNTDNYSFTGNYDDQVFRILKDRI